MSGPDDRPSYCGPHCGGPPLPKGRKLLKEAARAEEQQDPELVPVANDPQLQRWILKITKEQSKASETQYGQLKLALEALDVRMEELLLSVGSISTQQQQANEAQMQLQLQLQPQMAQPRDDEEEVGAPTHAWLTAQAMQRDLEPGSRSMSSRQAQMQGALKRQQDPEPEPTATANEASPGLARRFLPSGQQAELDNSAFISDRSFRNRQVSGGFEGDESGTFDRASSSRAGGAAYSGQRSLNNKTTASADFLEMRLVTKQMASNKPAWQRKIAARLGVFSAWWRSLQEPRRTGLLADVITGTNFQSLASAVIMLNAIFTVYSTNYTMEYLTREPSQTIQMCENFFHAFYTTELLAKLVVHRIYFFCNEDAKWNTFDLMLVAFSWVDLIISMMVESGEGGANLSFMRTLRILKMAKILRGVRVIKVFAELRLMLNSLVGSVTSLFWSIMMLVLIFYLFGLVFVQGVSNHLLEEAATPGEVEGTDLMHEFGRVERAMLTLYKASTGGDDWSNFLDSLEVAGGMYTGLFAFFIAFAHIALLNILTAIFVNNAMMYAMPDREAQAMEALSTELQEYQELTEFLNGMDKDGNGYISSLEFTRHCKTGKLGLHLTGLGLNIKDTQMFFLAVAESIESENPSDEILIKDFVDGCMQLRGNASCIDLRLLSREMMEVQKHHTEDFTELKDMLYVISDMQEQALARADQALAKAAQQEQALAKANGGGGGGKPGDISRC